MYGSPKAGLYGLTNPPPSKEIAAERLQVMQVEAEAIEVQLEHADPGEYENENSYLLWRRKALRALAYYRTERNYLEQWLALQPLSREKEQELLSMINKAVEDFRGKYQRVHDVNNPPNNLQGARSRLHELQTLVREIEGVFITFSEAAKEVDSSERKRLRSPLVLLLQAAQEELRLVKGYLQTSPHFNRLVFLLSLVERGLAMGLPLSVEEHLRLQLIRDQQDKTRT